MANRRWGCRRAATPPQRSWGRLAFEDLVDRSLAIQVLTVDVQLASLEDIVASKRFAARDKDREALPELEQLLADQPE
ncbi:MAG: hypothetical protein IT195_13515 [Microthrixaceae bacterium]|nr:hypothetical protein [Microthrixaceae bacterium]